MADSGQVEGEGSAARILEAASALLVESGYQGLSMRKVAAKVGLSQAAIYRHYQDKAELVGRIVEAGYQRLLPRLEALESKPGSPRDRLAEGIRAYVAFALEAPDLFQAVLLRDIGPAGRSVEAFSAKPSRQRRSFAILEALVAEGMAEGDFAPADPGLTAQALWSGMFGLSARLALEKGARLRDPGPLVERGIEIMLAGLAAAPMPKEYP